MERQSLLLRSWVPNEPPYFEGLRGGVGWLGMMPFEVENCHVEIVDARNSPVLTVVSWGYEIEIDSKDLALPTLEIEAGLVELIDSFLGKLPDLDAYD